MEGRHEDDEETAEQLEEIFKVRKTYHTARSSNLVFDAEFSPPVKVYQPAGEDERAAIGFRQSENSTIEENAKEVLHLLDLYYNTSF